MESIKGVAEVVKVQTLVDNGIRLTIDLPETAIYQAAALMELKREGVAINYLFTPRMESVDSNDTWEGVTHAE